jgi:hypothetical protein
MKVIYTKQEWVKFKNFVNSEECADLSLRLGGPSLYDVAVCNPHLWGGPICPTTIEQEPEDFRDAVAKLLDAWPDGAS